MFELALHKAYFVVRRHAVTHVEVQNFATPCGSIETGTVTEQVADVVDANGQRLRCRLITLHLYQPTRDGDRYIQILTNLPTDVSALVVAKSYRVAGRSRT